MVSAVLCCLSSRQSLTYVTGVVRRDRATRGAHRYRTAGVSAILIAITLGLVLTLVPGTF
ncbi:hypothetical protein ACIBF1_20930 [Spirillospora sp. NPDC050679]